MPLRERATTRSGRSPPDVFKPRPSRELPTWSFCTSELREVGRGSVSQLTVERAWDSLSLVGSRLLTPSFACRWMNQRLVEAGEQAVPVKTMVEDMADGEISPLHCVALWLL